MTAKGVVTKKIGELLGQEVLSVAIFSVSFEKLYRVSYNLSLAHTLFIITQFFLILPFEMITAVNEMSLKKNHALYIIKYVAILFNTFH